MWKGTAVLAVLILCLTGFGAYPEPSPDARGGFPVSGLDFELVDGSGEELRCTLTAARGLRAGYREKNDMGTWFVALYRDRTSCRAVAGAFKLELGSGLLFGSSGRFFCYTWRRSPPRRHIRIAPSLSLWNRQVGAALSIRVCGVTSHLALFEKPGSMTEDKIPQAGLVALSSGSSRLWGGIGVVASIGRDGGADTPPAGRARLYHLFSSVVLDELFATGEFDLLAGKQYGLIEIGLATWVRGSLKLFRAPDLKDIGIWNQAIENSCDELSGMVIHAVLGTGTGTPRLQVQSTVRNQDTRRYRRRSCGLTLSGKTARRRIWEVDCTAREEHETEYPSSLWATALQTAHTRDVRLRTTFRTDERSFQQVIRTDLVFNRLTWKPDGASAAVETRMSWRRFAVAGKIQAYSFQTGCPMALFRPGVGSFEYLSLVYGQGSDLCVRARIALKSGVSLTGFYGKPWGKSAKVYTAIRWKF